MDIQEQNQQPLNQDLKDNYQNQCRPENKRRMFQKLRNPDQRRYRSVDFFPLSVDYEERLYAVGKIPGGFIKREGRPNEKANCRLKQKDG